MAISSDVIRRLTVVAEDRGLAETTQKLERLSSAQEGVAVSGQRTERAVQSVERMYSSLQRRYDAVARAEMEMARVQRIVDQARSQGIGTEAERTRLLNSATAAIERQTGALNRLAAADRVAAVANDNGAAFRRRGLGYQAFDVGQSLALGAPLAMVAMQQGPQIAQMYAGAGGLNAVLKDTVSLLGGVARAFGPVLAAAGLLYGAYRLLSSYSAEAALSVDDATRALAEQAMPLGSIRAAIGELGTLQKTYQDAIVATGGAQNATTAAILANTKKEFDAKKSLLSLELLRQDALVKTQQAELAIAGLELKREAGQEIFTRGDLEGRGFSDPRVGSVPFVRVPDEISGLSKTWETLANSPIANKIQEMRANLGLSELAADQLREALKATFEDGSIVRGADGLSTSVAAVSKRANEAADAMGRLREAATPAASEADRIWADFQKATADITDRRELEYFARQRDEALRLEENRRLGAMVPIPERRPNLEGLPDPYADILKSADERIRQLRQEQEKLGLTGAAAESLAFQHDMLNQAMRAGIDLDDKQIAKLREKADAYAAVAQEMARTEFRQGIAFEREQLFRSPQDQDIARQLRPLGLGLDSIEADELRSLDRAKEIRGEVKGFFDDLRQGIMSGDDIGEAIKNAVINALMRSLDKQLEAALDMVANAIAKALSPSSPLAAFASGFPSAPGGGGDIVNLGADLLRKVAGGGGGAALGGTAAAEGRMWGAAAGLASAGIPANGNISLYGRAIQAIESGGNYSALGPITRTGDRAYGAYQVMGANIPSWTRDALGRTLTPSQFLANPGAQDAVFNNRFGGYVERYGNPQDAASAWFTGGPLSRGAHARDILGTSGSKYVDDFNAHLDRLSTSAGAASTTLAKVDRASDMASSGLGKLGQTLGSAQGGFPAAPSGGGGGGGSFLSRLFNFGGGSFTPWEFNYVNTHVGLFHEGGVAGYATTMRYGVDPRVFIGAPRYHNGGIAGDEVPAILKRGEPVFKSMEHARQAVGGNVVDVRIHMDRDGNWQAAVERISQKTATPVAHQAANEAVGGYAYQQRQGGAAQDDQRYRRLKRQA